jgi:hypothetical protein
MIYAEQGNRIKVIQETEIQRYVEKGYTITDGRGTVIKETVPTDMATLRLAYVDHQKEIKELNARIVELESALVEAQSKKTKPVQEDKQTAEEPVADEVAEEVEEAPKPRRGRTSSKATK